MVGRLEQRIDLNNGLMSSFNGHGRDAAGDPSGSLFCPYRVQPDSNSGLTYRSRPVWLPLFLSVGDVSM